MTISFKLGVKQSQKLVMTQALRQSIEMLQLSTVELAEEISKQLIENPVIEEGDQNPVSLNRDDNSLLSRISRDLSGDVSADSRREEFQNNYVNTSESGYSYTQVEDDRKRKYIENVIAHKETLAEHLIWQAMLSAKDEKEFIIFQSIITSLDENGFLLNEPSDFTKDINTDIKTVKNIISAIQLFDPVGCGTKDIQTGLIIQAKHYYPDDYILHKIITEFFIDLEKLNYDSIARSLSISIGGVIKRSKMIQNLNPFPGRNYSTKEIKYIIPDIEVKLVDDDIIINLNDDWVPAIRINSYYVDILKRKNIEKKHKDYIQEKIQSAKYFVKNISNRRETIISTVKSIIVHQRDFFLNGPGHLKHLTHLDIANEISVHESTISRVTSNKYVQTSWGVFPLKYFFVSKLKSYNPYSDEKYSSDHVKKRIQLLIKQENPEKPLSDEEIVGIFKKEEVSVARRTIAKYRGILNIPASNKRKKLNKIIKEESL